MKLIIDISKEAYNGIKMGMRNRDDMREVGEAIENGIPLDKIRAEIYEHFMTIDGKVYDKSAIKCMEIIGKYKEGESSKIIRCPNCGNENFADKKWCPDCGAKIEEEEE